MLELNLGEPSVNIWIVGLIVAGVLGLDTDLPLYPLFLATLPMAVLLAPALGMGALDRVSRRLVARVQVVAIAR